MFLIGIEVIKEEVFKRFFNVFLVYIVVYGCMEIGEIVLVLNFIWEIQVFKEKDYMLIMRDVLRIGVQL